MYKVVALGLLLISAEVGVTQSYYPVLHQFKLWGAQDTIKEKLALYLGYTNGFFYARGETNLMTCLQAVSYEQAIAMIDKQYKDHPEKWLQPIGEQIVEAVTIKGGPCEGKNPFPTNSH